MPADVMQELIGANEGNTNGTRDIVANAIQSIQSMPDCESLVKGVLKATTGFESLSDAAKHSGKSTSDILDRVAFVFEKITARANEAQASVYGFGSSFGKIKPNSLSGIEKRIQGIKNQFDLTAASLGTFSRQFNALGSTTSRAGSQDRTQGAENSSLTSQEQTKLRNIARFLDMNAASMFKKTLSMVGGSSGAGQSYAKTGVQYDKRNQLLGANGGTVKGVDRHQDSQLAFLRPGEFVVPKNQVQQFRQLQKARGYELGGVVGSSIRAAHSSTPPQNPGEYQKQYLQKLNRLFELQKRFDDNLDDKFYSMPDIPSTFPKNESEAKKAAKNIDKVFNVLMNESGKNALSDIRNNQINGTPIPSVHISKSDANRISGSLSQSARASHGSEAKKSYAYVGRQIKQNQGSSRATGAILQVAQQMFGIRNLGDITGLDEDDIKAFSEALQDARDIIEDAKNTTSSWGDIFENLDEEADDFAKHAIGGMGVLGKLLKGNLVGTMAKVGAFVILGKAISDAFDSMADFAPKLAEISAEYTKMQQSVAALSGEAVNFEALRNELTLTKEEAAQLGESYQKVAMNGINSVQTVTAIARSMKETMGKVDISALRDAVDLIESLPKEQVSVLISGVGAMDDKANLIANLMEDGNLDRVIKLQMSGAFGQQEGMPQLSERDKAVIDAQQEANRMLEDVRMLLYEHLPGIAWSSAIVGSKAISILAKLGTFAANTIIIAKAAWKLGNTTNGFAIRTNEVGARNLPSGKIFKHGINRRALSRGVLKVAGRTQWGKGLARAIAGNGARAAGASAHAGAAAGGAAHSIGSGIMAFVKPAAIAGAIAYAISKPIAFYMEKHAKKLRNKYEGEKAMERAKNESFYGNALGRDAYDDVRSVKIAGVEGAAKGLVLGATMGALVGSIVPGIGTVIGGIVGGLVGAVGGSFVGKLLAEREVEMKGAFYRDRKRNWYDYNPFSGTLNAHDTNKSIISRILGGVVGGPFGAIAGDLLFGDSHARENTDPDGIRKKYYDRMFDRLDDLNMALSGQVLLGEDGKPVVAVDENEKDSSDRAIRRYTLADEFGNVRYDAWGKPIQVTIEEFRKQQMKKLVELNKNVKRLEFIVKDKYTQFNQQLVKAGLANLDSMSTIGGTNENFGAAVRLVSSQATKAYTTKLDKLNAMKVNAINSGGMDPEHRANLMAKIMQDEVKVHKDYVSAMMEVIGKLGEMPEVMVHDIKAGIVRAFADWKSESFSGTAGSAIQDSMAQVNETMQSSTSVFNQHLENLKMLEEASKKVEQSIAKIDEEIAKREEKLGLSVSQAEEIQNFYKDALNAQGVDDDDVANAQLADLAQVVEPIFKKGTQEALDANDVQKVSETIPQMVAIAQQQIDKLDPVRDKAKIDELKKLIEDLDKTEKSVKEGYGVNAANDVFKTLNLLQAQVTDNVRQAQNNAKAATEKEYGKGSYGHSMEILALEAMRTGANKNNVATANTEKEAQEKYLEQLRKQSDSFVAAITNAFENGAKKFADAMASIAEKSLRYRQSGAGGANAVADYYRKNRESAFAGMESAREAEKLLPEYAKKTEEVIDAIPNIASQNGWNQNEADYALTFGRLQQARQKAFQNPDDINAMREVSRLEAELAARGASVSPEFLQSNEWKALEAQLSITSKAFETFAQQLADSKAKVIEAWESLPDMIEKVLNNAEYAIARNKTNAKVAKLDYNNRFVDTAYAFRNGADIAKSANASADLDLAGEQKAYEQALAAANEQLRKDIEATGDSIGARNRYNETVAKIDEKHYKKRSEIQEKRLNDLNKVFDAKMGALDKRTQALEIQKDVLETIGAPFEYIVGIEQEMVRASKAKAAIEEERLQAMIDGGVEGEELEEQKLKVAKAQAQVIKDSFGAQRDSLDKMLGKIMGTFNEVGGIFGPDGAYAQVRKMGQGYVTNAQTGLNWAAGDTTITGYANRVAFTTGAIAGHQLPNGGYGWGGRGFGMQNSSIYSLNPNAPGSKAFNGNGKAKRNGANGEASAQSVGESDGKAGGAEASNDTESPSNANRPGGKAMQSDAILIEILKDTHRIIELMGGEANWDTVKKLLKGQREFGVKNEAGDLSKNKERNQYLAKNIDASLSGKSTAEMQSELNKLVNAEGERSEGSLKRQRNLESAILYDKLFNKKKGASATSVMESQEQSLDVQKEILKYVKLIYELLAGLGGAAYFASNPTRSASNSGRRSSSSSNSVRIDWDDSPFKAPVAQPVYSVASTPAMAGLFSNPNAFVNKGPSILNIAYSKIGGKFSRIGNWFRGRFGSAKSQPAPSRQIIPPSRQIIPPSRQLPPANQFTSNNAAQSLANASPKGNPVTPLQGSPKMMTLKNGNQAQLPSTWERWSSTHQRKWIKMKTLATSESASQGEINNANYLAKKLEAKYSANQQVQNQSPPISKNINFRRRVNNFMQSTKGKSAMTALSWLPVGIDLYHAGTAKTDRERSRGYAHASIDSMPAIAATTAILGSGRLAQGSGAMVAPLAAVAEIGKTMYDMNNSNDETMQARLDEWMGRSAASDAASYALRATVAGAIGAKFGGPIGSAVAIGSDFAGHAGSDIVETYGLSKYLERRSNEINNASAMGNVDNARTKGISEDELNAEVAKIQRSKEYKQILKQKQKIRNQEYGWGSNFGANLLTLGAQNRTGKAFAKNEALLWAQAEARKRIEEKRKLTSPKAQVQSRPNTVSDGSEPGAKIDTLPLQLPQNSMLGEPNAQMQLNGAMAPVHRIKAQREFGKARDLNTLIRYLDANSEGVESFASARAPQETQGGTERAKGENGRATADISGNIILEVNVKLDNEMLNGTIANAVQNNIERLVSVVINNPSGAAKNVRKG